MTLRYIFILIFFSLLHAGGEALPIAKVCYVKAVCSCNSTQQTLLFATDVTIVSVMRAACLYGFEASFGCCRCSQQFFIAQYMFSEGVCACNTIVVKDGARILNRVIIGQQVFNELAVKTYL